MCAGWGEAPRQQDQKFPLLQREGRFPSSLTAATEVGSPTRSSAKGRDPPTHTHGTNSAASREPSGGRDEHLHFSFLRLSDVLPKPPCGQTQREVGPRSHRCSEPAGGERRVGVTSTRLSPALVWTPCRLPLPSPHCSRPAPVSECLLAEMNHTSRFPIS